MQMRVAVAQMCVNQDDIAKNVATISRAIDFAARERAQVLLTPEGSLSGYRPDFDRKTMAAGLNEVLAKAKSHRLALALGTCFYEADGRCYDELRFYDPQGAFVGYHSKILLCGTLDDPPTGEINDYATSPLRTFELCGVTVGGLVCNDMWGNPQCTPMSDPHLLIKLGKMGARIVFHSVNGGRGPEHPELMRMIWNYHEANLRLRAEAAKVWVVTVDNAEPAHLPTSAPGGVIDPREKGGRWAHQAKRAGEDFFAHTIDLR